MMTSGGGGYCDCGDPEAWKSHPSCELHTPKSSSLTSAASNASDPTAESFQAYVKKLPDDVVQRATHLFAYLLEYIYEILSMDKADELPAQWRPDAPDDDYVTILYNDEVHSYEQVVSTLRKVLSIDDKKAFEYAAIVDKEGRSTIRRDKKADCMQTKSKVEATMSGGGAAGVTALATRVFHHSLIAHQYFAERLIVWLQKMCEASKGLKYLLCQIGLTKVNVVPR